MSSSGQPAPESAETPDLFVYGTLVLDEVVATLIDRVPRYEDASAVGWKIVRLPGKPYPGLVADQDTVALGRVYLDLEEHEWGTLDAFEDPSYSLTRVKLASGRSALTYVWPDDQLSETWSVDQLTGADLEAYLERCASWRRRHEEVHRQSHPGRA